MAEIHTAVFTDTADYHPAGADTQDQVVGTNLPTDREQSHPQQGGIPRMFYFLLSGNRVASTGVPFFEGEEEPVVVF